MSTMQAEIDISQNLLGQFQQQLQLDSSGGKTTLEAPWGKGTIKHLCLIDQLELYHFNFTLNLDFKLHSFNPRNSPWLLLNVNLSQSLVEKTVNSQSVQFHKFLPAGILYYQPGTEVYSSSPANVPFSILLIRFHESLLSQYGLTKPDSPISSLIYEDLDHKSESLLSKILQSWQHQLMDAHAHTLLFLSIFFQKIKNRTDGPKELLHPDDIEGLFKASVPLRNPLAQQLPSVENLSKIAGMGTTKFKNTFKQVFGTPPIQYHQKIKMDYARDELLTKRKTPSQLSYELGYSHPSKFTLAYKKQFGEVPSES